MDGIVFVTMVLFLILSSPLAVVAGAFLIGDRVFSHGPGYPDRAYLLIRSAVLPGIVLFVVAYLVALALEWVAPYSYSLGGLYVYHLVTDIALWTVVVSVGGGFVLRRTPAVNARDRFYVSLLFTGVVFGLLSVAEAITHEGYRTMYDSVLLPLIRSGCVLLVPVLLSCFFESFQGGPGSFRRAKDAWYLVFLPLYVAGGATVPMWSDWLRPAAATASALTMSVLAGVFLYVLVFLRRACAFHHGE